MTKTEVFGSVEPTLAPAGPHLEAAVSPPTSSGPRGAVPGGALKHFRIDARLAAGGMGEVFLGFDTSLSRPVAIKTIRVELARDESFLARFVREATAQANVVHPHVAQVYFVGEDAGTWFLAMQLVDGGSLHDVLDRGSRLRWQDAARHMIAVCEGLVVAERLGIVHRDIKPANILVDKTGRALLSDFGLAASVGIQERAALSDTKPGAASASASQLQLASVTQLGVVMGTPEYVAPEQLRAGAVVDARSDVYALAATFFHLLTGRAVMPVPTLQEAIARYARGERAPALRTLAPGVPQAFAAVIDRCLSPEPSARPTMAALAGELAKVAPQPEVPASPPLRALVWLLDVAPFLALAYATYARAPWVAPLAFVVAGLFGASTLHATPGIWMMRLRLRTSDDGDVSFARGFARFALQHGWVVPLVIGFAALYRSSDLDVLFFVGAAWLAVSVVGSLGALGPRGRTLHDALTGTRVLVDVRYR